MYLLSIFVLKGSLNETRTNKSSWINSQHFLQENAQGNKDTYILTSHESKCKPNPLSTNPIFFSRGTNIAH